MTIAHKTANAGSLVLCGKLLSRGLDFLTLIVLARLLSLADFGLVGAVTAVLVLVEVVLDMPLVQALMRQPVLRRGLLYTAFTLAVLRALGLYAVLALLSWPLALFYGDMRIMPLMLVMALAPALRCMVSPAMVVFMRRMDFRREFLADFIAKLTTFIVAANIAFATKSYWALPLGMVAGQAMSTIISYIFAPLKPRFTLADWREFADMMGWNTLAQMLDAANWQLDRLLLPRFVGVEAFGRFAVADSLSAIPHQTFVSPLMRPLMAAFVGVQTARGRREAYLKAVRAACLVAMPVLLVLIIWAEPVVRAVAGEKWREAAPLLSALCLASLIGIPATVMTPLMMVLNKTRYVALRMLVEFVVRVPFTLAAIVFFGIQGALWARILAVSIATLVAFLVVRGQIGVSLKEQFAAFAGPLLSGMPLALFLALTVDDFASLPEGITLLALVILGSGLSLGLYWLGAFSLWAVSGKKPGLESVILEKLQKILRRLQDVSRRLALRFLRKFRSNHIVRL